MLDLLPRENALVARTLRVVAAGTGHWRRTFTIITTRANRLIVQVHDRMPVILEKELQKTG